MTTMLASQQKTERKVGSRIAGDHNARITTKMISIRISDLERAAVYLYK